MFLCGDLTIGEAEAEAGGQAWMLIKIRACALLSVIVVEHVIKRVIMLKAYLSS